MTRIVWLNKKGKEKRIKISQNLALWLLQINIAIDLLLDYTDPCLLSHQITFLQETLVNRVLKITNEKPWLWAVFVLVGGLPVTLFIYFRCTSKVSFRRTPHLSNLFCYPY